MFRRFLARTFSPHARRRLAHRRLGVWELEDRTAPAAGIFADVNTLANSSALGSSYTNYAPAVVGSQLIYPVFTSTGSKLWQSDGTAAGTAPLTVAGAALDGNEWNNQPFATLGTDLYFLAAEKLYKTSGAAAPTLVVDLSVAGGGRTQRITALDGTSPHVMQAAGGRLFFSARTYIGSTDYGNELWTSDGTAAGTTFVQDLVAGSGHSGPSAFTAVGGSVVFTAASVSNGSSFVNPNVWSYRLSDGTVTQLTSFSTASFNGFDANIGLVVAGGRAYFGGTPASGQTEQLWSTGGTAAGTVAVPTATASSPSRVTAQGSGVVFRGTASGSSNVLCVSNGSGTAAVAPAGGGAVVYANAQFATLGSLTYFAGSTDASDYELWQTDGTTANTKLVKDVNPGSSPSFLGFKSVAGGRLYFQATTAAAGNELWSTDGTTTGTALVADLTPGTGSSTIVTAAALGNQLVFSGGTVNDIEPWVTDGTAAGTFRLADIAAGTALGSYPSKFAVAGSTLFFLADDHGQAGSELWRTDGTAAGTVMVNDPYPGNAGSQPSGPVVMGGYVYAVAQTASAGTQLVRSKTAGGAPEVIPAPNGVYPLDGSSNQVVASANRVFFQDQNYNLLVSDGTAAGTTAFAANGMTGLTPLGAVGNSFYFVGSTAAAGAELWRTTTGTAAAATLVTDINPGSAGSSISLPKVSNGRLFFLANNGTDGAEVWSVGETGGATEVSNISVGNTSSSLYADGAFVPSPGNPGSWVFDVYSNGYRLLYLTDGTPAGTTRITTTTTVQPVSRPVAYNGAIYFVGYSSGFGNELWTTDGTAIGTSRVTDLAAGANDGVDPNLLAVAGGKLVFAGRAANSSNVSTAGTELYASDGTAAGTALLADLNPGAGDTAFGTNQGIGAWTAGGYLYFAASTPTTGYEIYRTDGTAAGTALTGDLNPGSGNGLNPNTVVFRHGVDFNGTAVFVGTGPLYGEELYSDAPPAPAPTAQFATTSGTVAEAATTYNLTVSLSAAASSAVSVPYTLSGTATSGSDYTIPAGPLVIPAGQTSGTITVTVLDDAVPEPTETLVLTLGTPTGATLGTNTAFTLSITDADVPVAQFATASGSVGESGGSYTVTVSLNYPGQTSVIVPYTLSGTATSGSDYTIPAGPLVIPAGQTSGTVTVTILNDTVPEPSETVVLTLGSPTGATLGATATHTLTITDDDVPTAKFSADAAAEEWAGAVPVTVYLNYPSPTSTTLTLQTAGTATGGADYTLSAGSVTIPAGQTSGTFSVNVVSDADDTEGDETVVLSLTGSGFTPPASPYTLTVRQRPTVNLSVVGATSVAEAAGSTTVRATLSRAVADPLTVAVTATGTASAGDYTLSPTGFSIPAGQTTADLTFTAVQDTIDETDEVATLAPAVGTGTGPRPAAGTAASVTILDDDGPTVSFVTTGQSVNEFNSPTVVVRVQLSAASPQAVTVPLTYAGTATSGSDYTVGPSSVTVPAGQTTATFSFNIIDDTLDEPAETIVIGMGTVVNGTAGTPATHTVTIDAGEPANLTWTTAPLSGVEGAAGTYAFTAHLSRPLDAPLTVPVVFAGTATRNLDYTASADSVTFAAGVLTATVTVSVRDDLTQEPTERVTLTLPSQYSAAVQSATATTYLDIIDDDLPPAVSFLTAAQTVSEATPTATVTIRLSAATDQTVTVPFTLSGTATYGSSADYTLPALPYLTGSGGSWQVTFAPGVLTRVVPLGIVNDAVPEPTETVRLALGTPTNAGLDTTSGASLAHTVTITDDDQPQVQFNTYGATLPEGQSYPFSVLLYTLNAAGQRVPYATPTALTIPLGRAGTADASDYSLSAAGSVTIPAGQSQANLSFYAVPDGLVEPGPNDFLTLTLQPPAGVTAGSPASATFGIIDRDVLTASLGGASATSFAENGGTVTIPVYLSARSGSPVVVSVSNLTAAKATGGPFGTASSAASASDFSFPSTVTIPAGQTSGTITVRGIDDQLVEGTEWLTLKAAVSLPGQPTVSQEYKLNILDDDVYAEFGSTSGAVVEGNSLTLTVYLSGKRPVATAVPITFLAGTASRNDLSIVANGGTLSSSTTTFNLTVPANQTYASFDVVPYADGRPEGIEKATFAIGAVTSVVPKPGANDYALSIADKPTVSWATADVSTPQAPGKYTLTATLSSPLPFDLYVPYSYSYHGVAYSTDFTDTIPARNVYFPAHTVTESYTITVNKNTSRRSNGYYTVSFGKPSAGGDVSLGSHSAFTLNLAGYTPPPPPAPPRPAPAPPPTYNPAIGVGTLAISTSGTPVDAVYGGVAGASRPSVVVDPSFFYPSVASVGTVAVSFGENGFVAGATVFLDVNHNFRRDDWVDLNNDGIQDPGEFEPTTTTKYDGSFALDMPAQFDANNDGGLDFSEAQLVMVGGTDLSTNRPVPVPMAAPPGSVVVTPLTTLLTRLMTLNGWDELTANTRLTAALGLPNVAVAAVDHGGGARNGDLDSARLKQAVTALNDLVIQASAVLSGLPGGPSQSAAAVYVYDELADRITAADSTFDFQFAAQVGGVLDGAAARLGLTLPDNWAELRDGFAAVSAATAGELAKVPADASGDAYLLASAWPQRVAQADAADALAAAAAGTRTVASVVDAFTGSNLTAAVANAAIGDVLPPTLSVSHAYVTEGDSGSTLMTFTVTLDRPTQQPGGVRVKYHTEDNTATAGSDYQAVSGELSWAAGESGTKTVQVTVYGDTEVEFNELFALILTDPTNSVISTDLGYGLIIADDALSYTVPDDGATANDLVLTVKDNILTLTRNDDPVWSGILTNGVPVTITGRDGTADTLTVDLRGTNLLSAGVTFNGGGGAGDPADSLVLLGAAVAAPTFTPGATGAGRYDYAGGGRISYTGVEDGLDAQPPRVADAGVVATAGGSTPAVTQLTVPFTQAVTVAAGAFTLTRPADGATISSAAGGQVAVSTAVVNGQTVATLTFVAASGSNLVDSHGSQPASLAEGVWVLTVAADKVATADGLAMAADYTTGVVVDLTPPTVTAVSRNSPAAARTNAAGVTFGVTFSEPVKLLTAASFSLTGAGAASATITAVAPNGPLGTDGTNASWTVTVATGADGDLGLGLTGQGTATDAAGNPLSGTLTTTDVQGYTIDKTKASVTATALRFGPVGTYTLTGARRTTNLPWAVTGVSVTFSEPVTATAGTLTLNGQAVALAANNPVVVSGNTVTWTLAAPLPLGSYTLGLATAGADAVTDLAGNAGLATAFGQAFGAGKVADVDGNNAVTSADLSAIRAKFTSATVAYDPLYDLNGDGVVDSADYSIARGRVGQ